MRIHADFSSYEVPVPGQSPVVQVEKVPVIGASGRTVINGKFLVPMPLDVDFPVDAVRTGSILTVSDVGGLAMLNCSADHGLVEGDIVTITGSAGYDGAYPVSLVGDSDSFGIPVAFGATSVGVWTSGDYLLNRSSGEIDGYDLVSQSMARLLAAYPMFGNVYFNPLLTSDHVGELDFTHEFQDPNGNVYTPRLQTGREPGDDSGQYPTHTALLAQNSFVATARPGLMVTDPIDIGPYTLDCDGNEAGTDEFMLWWKLYRFEVSEDINADFGQQSGKNEPALRYVEETDPEPSGFSAYISVDGGANWCEVGLLEPVAFCLKTKSVMIAFKNTSDEKQYIASYALLF